VKFKTVIKNSNLGSVILERGITLREYIVLLCYFAFGRVIETCVVL